MTSKRLNLVQELLDTPSSSDSSSEEFLLSSDDSSETSTEDFERNQSIRINDFMKTIDNYSNKEFKEHFRMERCTCNYLIDLLKQDKALSVYKPGRMNIGVEKGLYMTIWYLANTETFRQISDRFNVSKSTAHNIISKIIEYFVDQSKIFITWPNNENEKIEISDQFRRKCGIDGIIGAIDGCHIEIKKPSVRNHHEYYNRKGFYSILLQGVCNYKKQFIDVFCGEPGSMHDARLLRKSSLYMRGSNGLLVNSIVLGDSAYPSLDWLISPIRDNGNLTREQKQFNKSVASARVVIEHTFGLLKGRFRRLKFFENNDLQFIVKCVVAATVFHNICLNLNDLVEYDVEPSSNETEEIDESQI